MDTVVAPDISAWASLPKAIFPSGSRTTHFNPARAAYAAAEAEVLPVDAQTTAFAPRSTAFVIAIVIPRSLNEHVGFNASYFRYNSNFPPMARTNPGAGTSGVLPSSKVTTGVVAVTGRKSA
jgi:hypothetical protein